MQEQDVITSYPTCDEWLTTNDLSREKDLEAHSTNLAPNKGMFSQQIIDKDSQNFRCCEEIEREQKSQQDVVYNDDIEAHPKSLIVHEEVCNNILVSPEHSATDRDVTQIPP